MNRHTNRPDTYQRTLVACPHPGKTRYRTRHEAKRTLRILGMKMPRDEHGNKPKVYECVCGAWHLGHPPNGKRPHPAVR